MSTMADGDQSSTATLGRILSWIGYLWAVFAVLWGMGVAEAIGISGSFASSVGRSIFPAIVLIGVGRVMMKRAQVGPDEMRPDVSRPELTPPILPEDRPVASYPPPPAPTPKPPPRPSTPPKPVVEAPVDVVSNADMRDHPRTSGDGGVATPKHKSSQELIDEARRRWGRP